ncbi:MAG: type IX secretion system sortase PorU [Bacteroidales bacterium]|nr:type IX secretion system sortase PorU [Bacteroidales bacterium]
MNKNLLIIISILAFFSQAQCQKTIHYEINWRQDTASSFPTFDNAAYLLYENALPVFFDDIKLGNNTTVSDAFIDNIQTRQITTAFDDSIQSENPVFEYASGLSRSGSAVCDITLYPYFFDHKTKTCQLVESFDVVLTTESVKKGTRQPASSSILATGDWYRMKVTESGIYAIEYSDLVNWGIDVSSLPSRSLRIFAKDGYILPESNANALLSNPSEVPVMVIDGGDGNFDEGDKIIFYIEGPHTWTYNSNDERYGLNYNQYTDEACFFLNISDTQSTLISTFDNTSLSGAVSESGAYYSLFFYKKDSTNFLKSGNCWYGEHIGNNSELTIPVTYSVSEPAVDRRSIARIWVANKSTSSGLAYLTLNNATMSVMNISGRGNNIARDKKVSYSFFLTADTMKTKVRYTCDNDPYGTLALHSLELNLRTVTKYDGQQFILREPYYNSNARQLKYNIKNCDDEIRVWNITVPTQPVNVAVETGDNNDTFIRYSLPETKTPPSFVVFKEKDALSPTFVERTDNQNLFVEGAVDYLIITPPGMFKEQANKFGSLHLQRDGMSYYVADLQEIYNEFSCGALDVTAIRNFIRHIYVRTNGEYPKYVLMLGSATYDYKNTENGTPNLIPAFQSYQSLSLSTSYNSDDYYVLMDESEGQSADGIVDIRIGRIALDDIDEIEKYYDKVEYYLNSFAAANNLWKYRITGVADDGATKSDSQNNSFIMLHEDMEAMLDTINSEFTYNKVYLDAFPHVSTANGYRCPDATDYLIKSFDEGSLVVSYYGHGSKLGWADEQLLDIPSIQTIDNKKNMAFVIATTCDFYEFDNPYFYPAGKHLLLHDKGGAIALLSTSRVSYGAICVFVTKNSLSILNKDTYNPQTTFGDMYFASKQSANQSLRNYMYFGDPAIKTGNRESFISIDTVNDEPVDTNTSCDLKTYEHVQISGHITPGTGLSNFNGTLFYELLDRPLTYTTFGHEYATAMEFQLRNKILVSGKATVTDNNYSLSFRIPKDVVVGDKPLKLNLYANDTTQDDSAFGFLLNIDVDGKDNTYSDIEGPEINMYVRDSLFLNGGEASLDSKIYISLFDECGINTYSNDIGEDILLVVDNHEEESVPLNKYCTMAQDDYRYGNIEYVLGNLKEGTHSLTVVAYDLCGNVSEKTLDVNIVKHIGPKIFNVSAFPNPATDYTTFTFSHNLLGNIINATIDIFDLKGKHITRLQEEFYCSSPYFQLGWNCRDSNGAHLKSGTYIYKISISSDSDNNINISKKFFLENNKIY